uniref:Reverse transcriptase domain-containing protein n=1 Tax=Ascaris lumbricoides TaxID=6252 RepID=A0A0M3HXV8_ASCLU
MNLTNVRKDIDRMEQIENNVPPEMIAIAYVQELHGNNADFKRRFSIIDHISAVMQAVKRCGECKIPLRPLFVDFKKAFDSHAY